MRLVELVTLIGTATVLAAVFTGTTSESASAAPVVSTCGYAATTGGGSYPGSICWLDFSGYDSAVGSTADGQEFALTLGEYAVSFTVIQRPVAGWTSRDVVAVAATAPPFVMGVPEYYDDIPGLPFLYATAGADPFGAVQIAIQDFQVSIHGVPVTGYELVSAAPETPDAPVGQFGEWITWTSDEPLTAIDYRFSTLGGGGCVNPMIGDGTTTVYCDPASSGTEGVFGAILSAPSATAISGTLYMSSRGEREALGFGIRTARVTLSKQVAGRIDSGDSFSVSVTAPEGPTLGTASTGGADAVTTGALAVIPSGSLTLSEAASNGSPNSLDAYDASWSCTNARADSVAELPSGSSASQQLTLSAGDVVDCVITNTAKPTLARTGGDAPWIGLGVGWLLLLVGVGVLRRARSRSL